MIRLALLSLAAALFLMTADVHAQVSQLENLLPTGDASASGRIVQMFGCISQR